MEVVTHQQISIASINTGHQFSLSFISSGLINQCQSGMGWEVTISIIGFPGI